MEEQKRNLEPVPADQPAVEPEIEGHGWQYYYVCGECHGQVNWKDAVCRHCGRRINWNG